MNYGEKFLNELEKLRNGEEVKCDLCNKGFWRTPYDYKISHYFECDYCKAKMNID